MTIVPTIPESKPSDLRLVKTNELIAHRYNFFMSMLRSYVTYAQTVDNRSRTQVLETVNKMSDQLVARHSFGSQFLYDIRSFINAQYNKSHITVMEEFRKNSNVPGEVFDALLDDFNTSTSNREMHASLGNRFHSIIK